MSIYLHLLSQIFARLKSTLPSWAEFFTKQYPSSKDYIKFVETHKIEVIKPNISNTYIDFNKILSDKKFDFVFIDGPEGSEHYSRPQLLEIANHLNYSFVVMLDDMDRTGERETLNKFKALLKENNIEFIEKLYSSDKTVGMICSPDLQYLTTL